MAGVVLQRVQDIPGVVGLAHHRGVSVEPDGDLVTIHTTNDGMRPVVDVLLDLDVHHAGSVITTEPRSLLSSDYQHVIDRESNETVWDEMAFLLRQDTNLASNYLALMALAGAVAAVGLWTDTLHMVIGAMVIAPAFEPLVRIPFGVIAGPRELTRRGLLSTVVGYVMIALGGLLAVLVLQVIDPRASSALASRTWVTFWSTPTATGLLASTFAAAAGAVVITGQRSVLTTGVMIALALIPSMSIVGMALAVGDVGLMGRGLVRWLLDVALVLVVSTLVLGLKQAFLHRRKAMS